MMIRKGKLQSPIGLFVTLCLIYFIPVSSFLPILLLALWVFVFWPCSKAEIVMFVVASISIIGQNYAVLKAGGFAFREKDFLLMPYYEPFLWGFYYLSMKRFIGEKAGAVPLAVKAFLGLALTGVAFSLFAEDSNALTAATAVTTGLLFFMFHKRYDLYYAVYALLLGIVIELFGVFSDLWHYPNPDILGIPFWFATMWISVGLLGRRFLIPFTEWLAEKLP